MEKEQTDRNRWDVTDIDSDRLLRQEQWNHYLGGHSPHTTPFLLHTLHHLLPYAVASIIHILPACLLAFFLSSPIGGWDGVLMILEALVFAFFSDKTCFVFCLVVVVMFDWALLCLCLCQMSHFLPAFCLH